MLTSTDSIASVYVEPTVLVRTSEATVPALILGKSEQ